MFWMAGSFYDERFQFFFSLSTPARILSTPSSARESGVKSLTDYTMYERQFNRLSPKILWTSIRVDFKSKDSVGKWWRESLNKRKLHTHLPPGDCDGIFIRGIRAHKSGNAQHNVNFRKQWRESEEKRKHYCFVFSLITVWQLFAAWKTYWNQLTKSFSHPTSLSAVFFHSMHLQLK